MSLELSPVRNPRSSEILMTLVASIPGKRSHMSSFEAREWLTNLGQSHSNCYYCEECGAQAVLRCRGTDGAFWMIDDGIA